MSYIIFITKKFKAGPSITNAFSKFKKEGLGKVLINSFDVDPQISGDFRKKLMAYYRGLGIKLRVNAAVLRQFSISASPAFFEDKSDEEVEDWANHQVDFMKNEFGDCIRFAILQRGGKAPQIFFMMSTERPNQKKGWGLVSSWIDANMLKDLQTRIAKHNAIYGLKRGESKRGLVGGPTGL